MEKHAFSILIGNKNASSWSLRAWLMLKQAGVEFNEHIVDLATPHAKAEILKYSPSGKVPLLQHHGNLIWESLAIGEYLAELFPEAALWPKDQAARAYARSISHEMHAGFSTLRKLMPFCLNETKEMPCSLDLEIDVKRIEAIWQACRLHYSKSGEYLFGPFTIADAMFAPVVLRFQTYHYHASHQIILDYCQTILKNPFMQEWVLGAKRERVNELTLKLKEEAE